MRTNNRSSIIAFFHFGLVVLICLQCQVSFGQFKRNGRNIVDPKGKLFVMRGLNFNAADWDSDNKKFNRPGLANFNKSFCIEGIKMMWDKSGNTARIVWKFKNKYPTFRDSRILGNYIAICAYYGVTAVVELHDYTGYNSAHVFNEPLLDPTRRIKANATYWAALWWYTNYSRINTAFQTKLRSYGGNYVNLARHSWSRYAILNIGNEIGALYPPAGGGTVNTDNAVSWSNSFITRKVFPRIGTLSPLELIRKAGYNGIIMIDAFEYGQDINAVYTHASKILAKDPQIVFAVHMYGDWANGGKHGIDGNLTAWGRSTYPIITGEFGPGFRNGAVINADLVLTKSRDLNLGWLAWTYWGEGELPQILDVMQSITYNNVKQPRYELLYGPNDPLKTVKPMFTSWGLKLFPGGGDIYNAKPLASRFAETELPDLSSVTPTPAPKLEVTVGDLSAKLFPNPTGGAFNLEFNSPEEDNIEVAVFDLKGSRLKQYKHGVVTGENRLELMAPDQPGVYVVQALTDKGKRFASTLVVSE